MLTYSIFIAIVEFIQIFSLALILPAVSLIVDPSTLHSSKYITILYSYIGIEEIDNFIIFITLSALISFILGVVINFFMQVRIERFTEKLTVRLAATVTNECIDTPYAWYFDKNSQVLTRMIHNDIPLWSRDFIGSLLKLFTHIMTVSIAASIIIITMPILGFSLIFIVLIFFILLTKLIQPRIGNWSRIKRKYADESIVIENQILSGIKDIKANMAGNYFSELFHMSFLSYCKANSKSVIWSHVPAAALTMISQGGMLIVLLTLWLLGHQGTDIVMIMTILILLASRMIPATIKLQGTLNRLIFSHPWVEGIYNTRKSIWKAKKIEKQILKGKKFPSSWHSINFENISYKYPDSSQYAIKNVSFKINKNKMHGIIGKSGAGKSTCVDLFLKLIKPESGFIMLDDNKINDIGLLEWRKKIGYVPQSPIIIDDSIRKNIEFGINTMSPNELSRIIETSGLSDMLKNKKYNIDTVVGDRGIQLSGGQKQRIAIARALYRKPEILILDESTSALDVEIENEIIQSICNLKDYLTVIIISHRVNTIKYCDEVITLSNGEIKT